MGFPESPRAIFKKKPTEKVICQLRFPTLLRLDSESPAQFQERIRVKYPLLKERAVPELGLNLPPEIRKILGSGSDVPIGLAGNHLAYDFSTEDEKWSATLTRDFIALSTNDYYRWEEFKDHLKLPLESFQEIYGPSFYSRIGLRYRDVIRKNDWGLKEVEWAELLQPHIGGELNAPGIGGAVQATSRTVVIGLEGGLGRVRIEHGLVDSKKTDEMLYQIDADFSVAQRTEVGDAGKRLDDFAREAGNFFRWCIKPRLYEAMEPDHL